MYIIRSIFLLFFIVLASIGQNSAFAANQKVGVVGAANDIVSALSDVDKNRTLKIGDDIFFKDKINTDDDGNAQLLFVDRSALTVGPNSSVLIDEFVYNPATSSGNMVMQGTKGTFRFIGGALSKKNAVKIKTPVGTIGIRGGIAIVQIDAISGATNATFVYGDTMTFENMTGAIQAITDKGVGIAVDTPTSLPSIVQLTPQQVASQVQELSGREGTNAGAVNIPTEKDIGDGMVIIEGDEPGGSGDQGSNAEPRGDKKNDKAANNKQGNKAPLNRQGRAGVVSDGENTTEGEEGSDRTASNNRRGGSTGEPRGNDEGRFTSDGGYVDENGEYHSPEEVAEYKAENPDEFGPNGEFIGDGEDSDNPTARGPRDPKGGPRGPRGGYAGGPVGAEGEKQESSFFGRFFGGDSTEEGGDRFAGGEPNDGGLNKPRDPGQLTSDGGYVDAEGNYHNAGELAAYRADQGGYSNDGGDGGNYYDPNGGYRPPADGGYYGGGDHYADGGYYDPNGGYVPPTDGSDGGYYGGGNYADGGYYDPNGGYIPPADGADGGYYYSDPYGGGGYYGGDPYAGDGYYYDPYAGDGYYYDPYAGSHTYYDPVSDTYIDNTAFNDQNNAPSAITHRGRFSFIRNYGRTNGGNIDAENAGDKFKSALYGDFGQFGLQGYVLLDKPTSFGYHSISGDFGIAGFTSSGYAFVSPNKNMYYYKVEPKLASEAFGNNPSVNEQNAFVVGRMMGALPTSGKQYFEFLPDMGTYFSSSQTSPGFFDWNTVNASTLPAGVTNGSTLASRRGMIVDWSNKAFLGGYLDWGNATLKSAYGKVNVNGQAMDGELFSYQSISSIGDGDVKAHFSEVYGDTATGVDGFIFSGNLYDPYVDIETPVVADTSAYSNTYIGGGALTTGFMAGFLAKNVIGSTASSYERYWNTEYGGTTGLSFSGAPNIMGATARLINIDGANTISARFGGDGYSGDPGKNDDDSASIAGNIYALEQVGMSYGVNDTTGIMDGVLISSGQITDSSMQCTSCDYVHWGVWAADIDNTTGGGSTTVDVAHIVPYISGQITSNMAGVSNVNATYTGNVFANTLTGSTIANKTGTFTSDINISGGAGTLTSFSTTITDVGTMSYSGSTNLSGATFSGVSISGGGYTGSINGALFGPQAENVGGNMSFSNGSTDGTGVYLGAR